MTFCRHSPFVLSSLPNAVAYDLEHREVVSDLTEYFSDAMAWNKPVMP
ncbi:MAG: hypothetical protein IJR86_03755 [Bacteroidaceae bacterium]|nr:hypothetical protein [Bacteroidaceae bacterium]